MRVLVLAAMVACSSPAKPQVAPVVARPSPADAGGSADASVAADPAVDPTYHQVCMLTHGREGPPVTKVVTCGRDLDCCYPCGEPGCDEICMTTRECNIKRP